MVVIVVVVVVLSEFLKRHDCLPNHLLPCRTADRLVLHVPSGVSSEAYRHTSSRALGLGYDHRVTTVPTQRGGWACTLYIPKEEPRRTGCASVGRGLRQLLLFIPMLSCECGGHEVGWHGMAWHGKLHADFQNIE